MNFEQIKPTREDFVSERETRAKERNKYRTVWQKILGKEKTGEMDIATEEALQMDTEIKKILDEGRAASTSEAIEVIEKEGNFGLKGKERISKEEWARFRTLQFGGALEENDFGKASQIIIQAQQEKKINDETKQILKETISPVIIKKLSELVQNRDGENFVLAFHELGRLQSINREDLLQENLQSPEIQNAIKQNIIGCNAPEYFQTVRDKWVKAGVVDLETANQFEEIKEKAKQNIIGCNAPEYFQTVRDKWVKAGVVDLETANQFEEIKEKAKQDIIGCNAPEYFQTVRDKWVKAGVVDTVEVNTWPEVIAKRKEK